MPTVKATFTADISQFRQSLAQASTAVTAFDRTVGQVAGELKKFGNQFSGATIARQAETMAKAIADIGGASRLTDAELKRANVTLGEALAKYKALGTEAPAAVRSLNAEIDGLLSKSKQLSTAVTAPADGARSFGLLQGAIAGVTAAITTQGLSAIKSFTSDLVETGGQISDLAAKTGLTTTQVQKFSYAASQTGSSVETITGAVTQLSNRLTEGGDGTIAAVQQLGLSIGDLQAMQPGEAFETIASAIARVPDPMRQTQLAMELFGRSGAEILPAIKAGLVSLGEEAETLGLIIDSRAVEALDRFGDQWDRLALQVKASAAGILGDTLTLIDAVGKAAAAAAQYAPKELTDSMIGRRLAANGPYAFGAVGIYGAAAAWSADQARLWDDNLPAVPGSPGTFTPGVTPGARTPAQMAEIERQVSALERQATATARAGKKTKELTEFQRELNAAAAKAFKITRDASLGWEEYAGAVELAALADLAFADAAQQAQRAARMATPIASTNYDAAGLMMTGPLRYTVQDNMTAGVLNGTKQATKATKDWRVELQGVAQAFAQLAQVGGPALQGLSHSLGTVFNAANAGQEMVKALSAVIGGLGTTDKDGKFTASTTGKALSGGLAGLSAGMSVGSLFTNRGKGFVAGAASGAAAGGLTGTWVGAGVGALVGAFAGMFAAAANAAAQRVAKDVQAGQLTAEFGGLDQLLDVVGQLGMNQGGFLKAFYGEPKAFAKAITELNQALARERQEADKLVKSLSEVARVQGVLSAQQRRAITGIRPGGPGSEEVLAFAAQQRTQAEQGITQAIAAIDAATAGGTQNMDQFDASIGAVTASLVVLFDTAVRSGESAIQVLQRLAEPIKQLQALLEKSGQAAGPGFGNLQVLTDIATGPQTGPLVQMAQGLGSALAGFANTGLLSPELFGDLANGIGEAYHQLELLGKGGLEAARLMQPSLQSIWQMTQDNPALKETLDETTLALLDFAEKSGLIGEGFRPAIDVMIDALNELIDTLKEFIKTMAGVPPLPAGGTPGGTPPPIPLMAAGGVVTRPTVALVGEAGPEAVIPLNKLGGMRGSTEQTINILLDGRMIAASVVRELPRVVRVYTGAA